MTFCSTNEQEEDGLEENEKCLLMEDEDEDENDPPRGAFNVLSCQSG